MGKEHHIKQIMWSCLPPVGLTVMVYVSLYFLVSSNPQLCELGYIRIEVGFAFGIGLSLGFRLRQSVFSSTLFSESEEVAPLGVNAGILIIYIATNAYRRLH